LKQFGWIHEIACPSENELYVAEILTWRVQKLILRPDQQKAAAEGAGNQRAVSKHDRLSSPLVSDPPPLSAGRGDDRLLGEVLPLSRLIEDHGRIDELERALVEGRLDASAHGDELALGQDLLALVPDQEIEEQHRRIGVRRVSREPFGRGPRDRRRNHEPVERRAPRLRLLGKKPEGGGRKGPLARRNQVGEKAVTLAHGHAVRGDDVAEQA